MRLAETTQPTYIAGGELRYIGNRRAEVPRIYFTSSTKQSLPDPLRDELSRLYPVASTDWPVEEVLYTVGVPSSSDSATWALLAVDFYRLAMFEAAIELQCPDSEVQGWELLSGEKISADARYAVELNESLDQMEEAADWARRKISAAADEHFAKSTDKSAAISDNWRAQFNSRLEALRAYLPVPPQMFDGWRVTPLQRVVANDSDVIDVDHETHAEFLSTDPYRWADYGFQAQPTECYIHAPDGPPPAGTAPLISTVFDQEGRVRVFVSTKDGALALPPSFQEIATEFRLEGYVEANAVRGATVPVLGCGEQDIEGVALASHCGTCPGGERGTIVGYAFPGYPQRNQLPGQFPVVTALKQSAEEDIAEHLLRTTRVDPRLATGNTTSEVDALIRTVAQAYATDHPGLLAEADVADVGRFLELFGTEREAFLNAANRVSQQALALGRGITPDPSTQGPIARVIGTEERADAAQAAYYMALAERSSHLATMGRLSEIVRPSEDVGLHFPLQQAQHGVRHAAAALLSVLDQPGFRLRQSGKLTGLLERVRARLRNDVTGWAGVYVGVAPLDGAQAPAGADAVAVALHDYAAPGADPQQTYEVWIGEAGLDCALGKRSCNQADYRFETSLFAQPTPNDAYLMFPPPTDGGCSLPPQARKFRLGEQCRLGFSKDLRVYVTRRDSSGQRRALLGFTLDGIHPVVNRQLALEGARSRIEPFFLIPFIGVREETEITETVAPDPVEPSKPQIPCTRTHLLTLEDELMEASRGKDDIESSFAYYLDVAKDAAERADRLGEEMLNAGLAIDQRSEIAREKLEELCGGVVNLERVEELAKSQDRDLADLLADQEYVASDDVKLNADLTALRNCIGIGAGNEPINVAVGTQDLCYWQYDPNLDETEGIKLPPCVLPLRPDGQEPATGDGYACPIRKTTCDQTTYKLPESSPFRVRRTSAKLNVSTGLEIPAEVGNTSKMLLDAQHFGCMLKRIPVNTHYSNARADCTYTESLNWVSHALFRTTGERLGVRLEPFFVAVITLDGREWIRLGRPEVGFTAANEWPCAPFSSLPLESAPSLNPAFAKYCTNSVLCGLPSGNCGSGDTAPSVEGWLEGQKRLVNAVAIVKALGGSSFANFRHYDGAAMHAIDGSYHVGLGSTPGWIRGLGLRQAAGPKTWVPQLGVPLSDGSGDALRVQAATWYRELTGSTWCIPVESALASAEPRGIACWAPRSGGGLLGTHDVLGAFDANLGGAGSGWIGRVLTQPTTQRAAYRSLEFDATGLGKDIPEQYGSVNPLHLNQLAPQDFADALELLAAANAQAGGRPGCGTGLTENVQISGPEDFPRIGGMLECAGQTIEGMVRDMMLVGIPASIAKAAATSGAVQNVVPGLRGEMGSAVGSLAGWLESYAGAASAVSRAIRDVGLDFEVAGAQLNINDSQGELADLAMTSRISAAAAACGAAVGNAVSVANPWGGAASALAVCADSAVQMSVAIKSNKAELEKLSEERKLALLDLASKIADHMDSIDDARMALGEAHANVQSVLSQVDSIRNQAKREVAKALGLESDDYGRVFPVSAVMRARYSTAKVRYERALWQAQEAAYLARRALEQRVGKDLSEIDKPMALVQAPSKWVDAVCAKTGLNYERIRKGNASKEVDPADSSVDPDPSDAAYKGSAEYDYADGFIGDYVTNLERVRDSWGLDFPFQDGDDVVVLSLRDDLLNLTTTCEVEGWNELLQTAHSLDDLADASGEVVEAWQSTCSEAACVAALDESAGEPLTCYVRDPAQGLVPSPSCNADNYVSDFGHGDYWPRAVTLRRVGANQDLVAQTSEPLYRQQVEVASGAYSLSWYQKRDEPILQVVTSGPASFTFEGTYTSEDAALEVGAKFLHPEWVRHYGHLQVDASEPLYVGWVVPETDGGVAFAAPQLERNSSFLPVPVQPLFTTGATRSAPRGLCADETGEALRADTSWRRGYETTCTSANEETCKALGGQELLEKIHFREITFDIKQEEIDQGKIFSRAGFSKGNFNYRHKNVTVNVVGTGVKNCAQSQFPSQCYGSNFLQYSLRHEPNGPGYKVRAFDGGVYEAPLFTGRIQQGKALVAERQLSNPISTADKALVSDFTSGQLWGRPLDGRYVLRVYDTPGLNWDALQDIQVVLDYRFWTRLD
jgi:hypothetical protein